MYLGVYIKIWLTDILASHSLYAHFNNRVSHSLGAGLYSWPARSGGRVKTANPTTTMSVIFEAREHRAKVRYLSQSHVGKQHFLTFLCACILFNISHSTPPTPSDSPLHPLYLLKQNEDKLWGDNWALTWVRAGWMKTDDKPFKDVFAPQQPQQQLTKTWAWKHLFILQVSEQCKTATRSFLTYC